MKPDALITNKAELLQELVDQADDLIQVVSLAGNLVYVNRSWTKHLGYNREEIIGKSIYDFIIEEDRANYREYRTKVIGGVTGNDRIVFRLRAKNNSILFVEGKITAKRENGVARYTTGIFRDITVRLEREHQLQALNSELKEREDNLMRLLINAPDAIIVINKESKIKFWNPRAEITFGWSADEVVNQPLQNIIIPVKYRHAHLKGMARYLSTGEGAVLNRTVEITAVKKNGEEFHVALTISPTHQKGEIAFIGFIRDITLQKQNQIELENKTEELEQFTHVSHHDLQEPLRKIITYADLLKTDIHEMVNETSKKHLNKISDAAYRMSGALKSILNYASLKREEQFVNVDLNEVLSEVKVDLELVIAEKQAKITSDRLPTINAISYQMHQLFYNLINNALKFSKINETPSIIIKCRVISTSEMSQYSKLDQSKNYYEIAVRDNGIGFQQEASGKIFGMFQRLHSRFNYEGTGIGLALCKKVVFNHGGIITAESEPDKGSVFRFLLPW